MNIKSAIKSVEFNNESISILFHNVWSQEQISTVVPLIFNALVNVETLELQHGADCGLIRLKWNNTIFILQFDCYSQSCWIDVESFIDIEQLRKLHHCLKRII